MTCSQEELQQIDKGLLIARRQVATHAANCNNTIKVYQKII